ncbi:MAG: DUF6607 family protein [Luteolibacter sp.]
MHHHTAFILLASACAALASPPEADRKAILAMAGNYQVTFDFVETFAVAPDYQPLSKPYHEEALEVVVVAEDTPERITLQHLLVVGNPEKSSVIKHWAQVWTWQDTRILDYAGSDGDDLWSRRTLNDGEASGQWSQLVTSVDDTPRYEGIGKWTHDAGESSWNSQPTRRPLPRREYEKRDDYDYLLATNRHTITAQGWVHTQENRKVVDRDGRKLVLSFETGLNQYTRTDDALASKARDWWKENAMVWGSIRNFWIDAGQQQGPEFHYLTTHQGVGLSKKFDELEKSKPAPEIVVEALTPYLSVSR